MLLNDTDARPPRRARNSLTVESILDAAERVAATGFDALTIRAVAADLQSSPMGLYRYFGTKDELVDALLDRVLGRFEATPETSSWIEDLGTFARHHRELLGRHPWAIAPLIAHPNPGQNALPIGEIALHILHRGGITGDGAVATFSGIIALNYGWSSFTLARESADSIQAPPVTTLSDFPLTIEVADALSRYGDDDHYDRVLGQLLAGIKSEGRP